MFGYIIVNKGELKVKEYERYHAFYCGLCRQLKEKYGATGQTTLSYDMTFLAILLAGLYEPEMQEGTCRCIMHPLMKHPVVRSSYTEYAADMNILLAYYKCKDDWNDEKKFLKLAYGKLINMKCRPLKEGHYEKLKQIDNWLGELSQKEKDADSSLDEMAGMFGKILGEIFAYTRDEWEEKLRRMGFFLGKFIYLMDAYEDIEQDIKEGNYNPLREKWGSEDFEEYCKQILMMMMAECSKAFELMPILEETGILRNILYSGVWYRFEMIHQKRLTDKVEKND